MPGVTLPRTSVLAVPFAVFLGINALSVGDGLVAGLAAQQPAVTISRYDRGSSQTMLKQIRSDLKANYYDASFHGIDLDAAFKKAEEGIRNAISVDETIAIISDVLMQLNDSHTVFIPPDRSARVVYGWQASMVGDAPYVVSVLPGSDAEKKGLTPGDRVLAWNAFEPTRQNLWRIYYLYNVVQPQILQRLVVRKPDGTQKTLDIESKLEPRSPMSLSELRRTLMDAMSYTADVDRLAGDTLVWKYTAFGDPREIDRVMKKARTAKTLVLDLRGNAGGDVEALRTLASWLFDRDVHLAVEKTRKGDTPLDAKARKDAFNGKLVVLVDSRSASAAEMIARVMQIEKRATVVGDRTMGAVMTSRMFAHTLGVGLIAFYATTITIGDVRMTDGGTLEGKGVTPDDTVLPTGTDLAAHRDPALARAITLLGGTMTPEQAGTFYR
jgi:carboxyl-terminal processing protease